MRIIDRAVAAHPVLTIASVGWLAFLLAIAATGVFFSLFDPMQLAQASGHDWAATHALGIYTIGFFTAWGSFAIAGLLAVWLAPTAPNGWPRQESRSA